MALIVWCSRRCKYFIIFVLVLYVLLSIYSAYVLLSRNSTGNVSKDTRSVQDKLSSWNKNLLNSHISAPVYNPKETLGKIKATRKPVVEIWGKAAIGLYLWEHIFHASLQAHSNGLIRTGNYSSQGVEFRFRTGPGVVPGYVPTDVEHLVLVLNGRSPAKVSFAQQWLEYVKQLPLLKQLAVVLLGNEKCDNDWILPYMTFRGGNVRVVFLTYDSSLVDNNYFYQWPLGVATYRNFPYIVASQIHERISRKYLCNFVGTVYNDSSRQQLVQLFKSSHLSSKCIIRPRNVWQPNETEKSMREYIDTLLNSDLTLCPVGINTECYRIYEAFSTGSVPVLEDKITTGNCNPQIPLRLLKAQRAPVLYVTNWEKELPHILEQQEKLSNEEKIIHRQYIISWYQAFKRFLKEHFVRTVKIRLLDM